MKDAETPDGLLFVRDFLSSGEQEDLLARLQAYDFYHDSFRGRRLKRAYVQFGYEYVSTGRRLEAAEPFPEFLEALIGRAKDYYPSGALFNQCIVTRYPPTAGIGWHTDAPRFGECILGVSLGSSARFQFRRTGSDGVEYEINAVPGSLYRMLGPARWKYQHHVPPVKKERYSLTFRHVE